MSNRVKKANKYRKIFGLSDKNIKSDIFNTLFCIFILIFTIIIKPFSLQISENIIIWSIIIPISISTTIILISSQFRQLSLYFNLVYPEFGAMIVNPIWEELIFRYLLFDIIDSEAGTQFTILIISLIFSILHPLIQTNLNKLTISDSILYFPMSLYLAILYSIIRNPIYCIIAHSTYNMIIFIGLWLKGRKQNAYELYI